MESATTIYKNGNELHTQPTSVQFHTLQSYAPGSSTFHPSASSTNLAQYGQKSTCTDPEIIFFQQNPEYTNTQQDLPDQWV